MIVPAARHIAAHYFLTHGPRNASSLPTRNGTVQGKTSPAGARRSSEKALSPIKAGANVLEQIQ
jgi:hypothetical protein